MNNDLECPVDFVSINENRARMVAFFVLLLVITCFITTNWMISAFLLIDFALRAFNLNNYSPLGLLSGQLITVLKIKNKPVDRAPKRFSAFIGLGFMVIITASLLTGFIAAAKTALAVIIIFAALESLIGFCAGCYVYSYLKRFKLVK